MSSEREHKPRVLIVDDSAFMRQMTTQILEESGEFSVCGTARDGYDAISQVHELDPDVVTLDVDMPELDGLHALGYIMSETPRPVIMLSAGTTANGKDAALRALELGAVDFLLKPSGAISLDLRLIAERLLGALRAAVQANPAGLRMLPTATFTPPSARPSRPVTMPPSLKLPSTEVVSQVVVIASSTGGPRALAAIVPKLPQTLAAPVLVVQHMPPGFTKSLAARLDAMSQIRVTEAQDGEPLECGHLYIAPGGFHMSIAPAVVARVAEVALTTTPPLWGVRPAADVLFTSAANVFGPSTIAVVLTGMGRDGADGSKRIRDAGGRALVQDRESATIYGMPQAALNIAGADRMASLSEIGPAIAEWVGSTAAAAAAHGH